MLAVAGAFVLLASARVARAQDGVEVASTFAADSATPLPPDQLDALVAPIALYPDPLLAQSLVAATYPLEIIQLQQWLARHPGLEAKQLADSVAKQPWDPSIQSMAAVPDVVKRLAEDIQWTTDLGNAFLAQQAAVMEAVQRMRKKAKDKGALESNEQQKVETQVVENKTVIVVESKDPEVIYVPSYSPTVVYGPPIYPYPPIYYPPHPPGAAMVSFTFGVMWGAAVWGGACCHAGWGGNNIYINNNNNFNQINHNQVGGANGNWQHDAQHRGGAPYADARTASKYGGSARGQSPATRPAGGAQGQRGAGVGTQPAGGAGGGRAASRGGASPSTGFSGGSGGYSGASARASSSRGATSMGTRSGGMSRGGGGGRRR